ncbi:hypothetical protein [Sandarakinorhabdus sp.]|uniref:hypothetical protein n=1 Tax=Sandarakinorhabdus sp. TaxID=1916663 RepID=UPI003F7007BF
MISRGTRLGTQSDQLVLFTLVELMTHLIFLALLLGLALRKEADPAYVKFKAEEGQFAALRAKCGDDGTRCVVPKPVVKVAGKGGQDLPNCLAGSEPLVRLRGLGDGRIAVTPGRVPAAMADNPVLAPFVTSQTLSRQAFQSAGARLSKSARSGALGSQACAFRASFCRSHGDIDLTEAQFRLVGQSFYVPFPGRCR